jgi:hypothetical protein
VGRVATKSANFLLDGQNGMTGFGMMYALFGKAMSVLLFYRPAWSLLPTYSIDWGESLLPVLTSSRRTMASR